MRASHVPNAMAQANDSPLPRPVPGAVFKRLPEGGVLFSTETEVYFGVGVVGARIWELLPPAAATLEEMVGRLATQFTDVSADKIRTDVVRFLDELLANGLVARSPLDPARGSALPASHPQGR